MWFNIVDTEESELRFGRTFDMDFSAPQQRRSNITVLHRISREKKFDFRAAEYDGLYALCATQIVAERREKIPALCFHLAK